jgi:dTDP-4-dehydrorhamnose 3,5-epimerase
MDIQSKPNPKFVTKDREQKPNGYLVPIYNIHDGFFPSGEEPQQVYLTVIAPREIKGPHLHLIRTGCFTCIKGNARFVLKTPTGYQVFYSGEDHDYRSVIVPKGVAAALQNLSEEDAYILNMPNPAWTPTMNDEHTDDFSDFDFSSVSSLIEGGA